MSKSCKHIVFSGQVQGVGFRFTVFHTANRYGLAGYVRNVHDGNVEMIVQGPAKDISNCLSDIKKFFAGYITDTAIAEIALDPEYEDFKITF